jgi:hypothetical protein
VGKAKACPPFAKRLGEEMVGTARCAFAHPTKPCARNDGVCATCDCPSCQCAACRRVDLTPNQWLPLACPASTRGVSRSSRTLGAGCDGRGMSRDEGRDAEGEVVWSWRPDAGAKLAKTLMRLAGDGGKRARSPGRVRSTPLKPSRRECRMMWLNLVWGVSCQESIVCWEATFGAGARCGQGWP